MTAIHPYRMKSEDDLGSMRSPSGPCNRVASKKTVAAENLVRLGAERLAGILLELAGEQPAIKRRLRLELAGEAGGEIIAAEISKRITALRSAQSFIDWQRRPDFVRSRPYAGDDRRSGRPNAPGSGARPHVAVHGACRAGHQPR